MTKRKSRISMAELKQALENDGDFLKPLVQRGVQEVLEAEGEETVGAAKSAAGTAVAATEGGLSRGGESGKELCGHAFSASTVSAINKKLDRELAVFSERPLEQPYPYLREHRADAYLLPLARAASQTSTRHRHARTT